MPGLVFEETRVSLDDFTHLTKKLRGGNGDMDSMLHMFSMWHPEVIVMTIFLGWLYVYVTGSLRGVGSPSREETGRQRFAFMMCVVAWYIASGSPVAFLSQNRLFSVFIVQMILMTLVMPWLLLISIPTWVLSGIFKVRWIYHTFRMMTQPFVALFVYNGLATIFFIPVVFEANLHANWLHIIDEWAIMVAAVFVWWPLVNQSKELPRLGRGFQLVYILFGTNFMMPIPVLLLIAQHPWYSSYASGQGLFHVLADQQLGGLLMIIGMGVVYGIRAVTIFMSYDSRSWYE